MTTAYFATHNPTDPLASLQREQQRFDYLTWATAKPATDIDNHRDFTEYAATLTKSTGHTARFIADNLYAIATLDKLPRLKTEIEQRFHVDMRRLRTIDNHTSGIHRDLVDDHDFWGTLDQQLSTLFTPTTSNQLLPGTARIRRLIKELISAFTPPGSEADEQVHDQTTDTEAESTADEQAAEHSPLVRDYQSWDNPDRTVTMELRVDQTTATTIHEAVRAQAARTESSRGQALLELILGNIAVAVTLNLYKAEDLPGNPGFLQPFGALDPADTKKLAALADRIRDADKAGTAAVNGYRPSDDIRAAVNGRDRICRWPGCNVPAHQCQLDHRINYAEGGPTTATEMLSLCPHHHQRKTDQQVSYLLDPITGDVYWLFQDGTWTVDLADGPLAPRQKHWNQTLAQKITNRQKRARERQANKTGRRSPSPNLSEEEKPPF